MIQSLALSLFLLKVPDLPTGVPDYNPNCSWNQIGQATNGSLSFTLYASQLEVDSEKPIWFKTTITNHSDKKLWLPEISIPFKLSTRINFYAFQPGDPKHAQARGDYGIIRGDCSVASSQRVEENEFFSIDPGATIPLSYECVDGYYIQATKADENSYTDYTRRSYQEGLLHVGLTYQIADAFATDKSGNPVLNQYSYLRSWNWKGRTKEWMRTAPLGKWEIRSTVRIREKLRDDEIGL
jgi:hypothetical protein